MENRKVVIDVILNDGTVIKGVENIDKQLDGLKDNGKKAALGIGEIANALGIVSLAKKGIDLVKDTLYKAFKQTDTFKQFEEAFANMYTAIGRGVENIITKINELLTSNGLPDMQQMIVEFGSRFEEVLNWIAEKIPDVVKWIQDFYEKLEPWLPLIKDIGIAVGTFITALATLNSVVRAAQAVWIAFNMILNANPIVLIISAIIAAAVLIYVYWEPISEFFTNLWEGIKEVSLNVWDSIVEAWNSTVEWFKEIWSSITDFFSELWEGIVNTATSIWDTVMEKWDAIVAFALEIFSPLIEFFSELWSSISETGSEIWETITETLSGVWENIQTIAAAAWEIIKNVILGPILLLIDLVTGDMEGFKSHLSQIWDNIKDAAGLIWETLKDNVALIIAGLVEIGTTLWERFKETLSNLWNAIKETASNIWDALKEAVINIVSSIKDKAVELWESLKQSVVGLVTGIKDSAIEAWETLKTKTREAFNKVVDFIKDPLGNIDLFQIGKDIIQGLIKGVGSMGTAVRDAAKNIARNVKNSIMSFLGVASPARELIKIGEWTGKGMVVGLGRTIRDIVSMAENMSIAATPEIPDTIRLVNRLRGVTAPLGNVMPISAVAATSANQANPVSTQQDSLGEKYTIEIPVILNSREIARETVDDITNMQNRKTNRQRRNPRTRGVFS